MKVFIDGAGGTTGLRIRERLASRPDVQLLSLPPEAAKDPSERKKALNGCDAALLCLPDAAAVEAVSMVENPSVTVLDTSTAHRTKPGWTYGFPELGPEFRGAMRPGARIAVPGCHASGFIALVRPLIDAGVLPPSAPLVCQSLSGYSGGGKAMIAQYEDPERDPLLSSPRHYALGQNHKHLPEMRAYTGLESPPAFMPVIADYYSGMIVTVPLFSHMLADGTTPDTLREIYRRKYTGPVVVYNDKPDEDGCLAALKLSGKDTMEISVAGNGERMLLIARYDNLGKGASGAAVQCLNIVSGAPETAGLDLV